MARSQLKELNYRDTKTQRYTLCFSVPPCLVVQKKFSRIPFRTRVRRNESFICVSAGGHKINFYIFSKQNQLSTSTWGILISFSCVSITMNGDFLKRLLLRITYHTSGTTPPNVNVAPPIMRSHVNV